MPTIKPFYGIRPNPDYAGEVVLDVENLSLREAKIIQQENPYSYVNMLVPKLDNLFLRGSKNELAFKKINENFDDFLDKRVLIRDSKPSIYIYQVSRDGSSQTGIWTITHVDDYLANKIKKHELTRAERERVLADYLEQTGIDANPVLIAYPPDAVINEIIGRVCGNLPELSFAKGGTLHTLWKIDNGDDTKALVNAFEKIPKSYIADGHHRAAAAALLALEHRKIAGNKAPVEEYNYFTTVYMSTDQLMIYPFHRIVEDLNGLDTEKFLSALSAQFIVSKTREAVIPVRLHEFGMYIDQQWYNLTLKTHVEDGGNILKVLDVSLLQDYVLEPILGILDPRIDSRISFSGGNTETEELIREMDRGEKAVLFTLFPTSIEQLIKVADSGEVMPPKSTWFEPKFQAGLLIHRIN